MSDDLILDNERVWTVSEARFAGVLETASDGIIVVDDKCRVLAFNRSCESLFGYSYHEVIGRDVKMLVPDDVASQDDDQFVTYLKQGASHLIGQGRELIARHRDGTLLPIEVSIGESQTPAGRQFIGILRDIRSRKAAEERVNQLQAQLVHMARVSAINEMGAAIAHELNQPLTAVLLYLQAITRRTRHEKPLVIDEQVATVLQKALKETERAGVIIQKMRKFIERRDPERSATNLKAIIEDAVELVLIGLQETHVEIRRDDADDLPEIYADNVQIQQIVVNLLRNAVEAVRSAETRWIRIATEQAGDDITVTVEDSGPGITEEAFASLFKAFASDKSSGLGLGLAISRSIAQNHGGDLSAERGGVTSGARFVLRLPINENGAADRVDPTDHKSHAGSQL